MVIIYLTKFFAAKGTLL